MPLLKVIVTQKRNRYCSAIATTLYRDNRLRDPLEDFRFLLLRENKLSIRISTEDDFPGLNHEKYQELRGKAEKMLPTTRIEVEAPKEDTFEGALQMSQRKRGILPDGEESARRPGPESLHPLCDATAPTFTYKKLRNAGSYIRLNKILDLDENRPISVQSKLTTWHISKAPQW